MGTDRGVNHAGFKFGFGLGRLDQFDLLEEIESGRIELRSGQFIYCVFLKKFDKFRLDCKSFDLRSCRIRIRSDQFDSFLNSDCIKSDLNLDGSNRFLKSDQILPPLDIDMAPSYALHLPSINSSRLSNQRNYR
jgi:hypothetical protein